MSFAGSEPPIGIERAPGNPGSLIKARDAAVAAGIRAGGPLFRSSRRSQSMLGLAWRVRRSHLGAYIKTTEYRTVFH